MKYVEDCVCPQIELDKEIQIKSDELLKKYPIDSEDFEKLRNLIMQYAQEKNCVQ